MRKFGISLRCWEIESVKQIPTNFGKVIRFFLRYS